MHRLQTIGRVFFAVAFVGLGITHFVFGDFMTGRAPAWPETIAGGTAWAYLSGVGIILAALAVLSGKKARMAALAVGVVIFAWALLRNVPVVAADSIFGASWTRAGKALVFFGGFFAMAGLSPIEERGGRAGLAAFINQRDPFLTLGRICLAIFLLITGIQHFLFTEFVASLIPGWFPGNAVLWTQFAGVALISGGAGLLLPQTAQLAALLSGVMVFSWFWIIHIPRSLGGVSDRIAVYEALAVAGLAFVLAGWLGERRAPTE
jgi:uncharacterized membrane protein